MRMVLSSKLSTSSTPEMDRCSRFSRVMCWGPSGQDLGCQMPLVRTSRFGIARFVTVLHSMRRGTGYAHPEGFCFPFLPAAVIMKLCYHTEEELDMKHRKPCFTMFALLLALALGGLRRRSGQRQRGVQRRGKYRYRPVPVGTGGAVRQYVRPGGGRRRNRPVPGAADRLLRRRSTTWPTALQRKAS